MHGEFSALSPSSQKDIAFGLGECFKSEALAFAHWSMVLGKKPIEDHHIRDQEKTTAPHAVTLALHILFTCFFSDMARGKTCKKTWKISDTNLIKLCQ